MNIIATITKEVTRCLLLRERRRELKAAEEHLATLWDQVISGQEGIKRYQAKVERLQAQVFALESPDQIVRRLGAGA